jgi:hypothetical protein
MAETPDNYKAQLHCLISVLFLAFNTGMQHAILAKDPCVESLGSLLPPLGIAMIMQDVSVLAFLSSTIWTGKVHKKPFVYWQMAYCVSCAAYAYFHWPSMAGLWIGTMWSVSVVCNIPRALEHLIKADKLRLEDLKAHLADVETWRAKKRADGDDLERVYRTEHHTSSLESQESTSSRRRCVACLMFSYSGASTFVFVFAYQNGTLETALKTFGLGFLGMFIVCLGILEFLSDESADSLADDLRDWTKLSSAMLTIIALVWWLRDGIHETYGLISVVFWSVALHIGIAEILEGPTLDLYQELGNEQHDKGDADGDSSDSWELVD